MPYQTQYQLSPDFLTQAHYYWTTDTEEWEALILIATGEIAWKRRETGTNIYIQLKQKIKATPPPSIHFHTHPKSQGTCGISFSPKDWISYCASNITHALLLSSQHIFWYMKVPPESYYTQRHIIPIEERYTIQIKLNQYAYTKLHLPLPEKDIELIGSKTEKLPPALRDAYWLALAEASDQVLQHDYGVTIRRVDPPYILTLITP